MEEKIFKTLIRKDHKLGKNIYVRGVVFGIMYTICETGKHILSGTGENNEGYILVTICTPELYEEFSKRVEDTYPGLCIFNYEESK